MDSENEEVSNLHRNGPGKLRTENIPRIENERDLEMVYTPGVAKPCREISETSEKSFIYTIRGSTVGVVSDGSAVLGLGDIGPEASMPVLEGKCNLLNKFGGVNAFPVAIEEDDAEDIIEAVKSVAKTFGAINLEDIAAPKCFEIETSLKRRLDIPVFHDDQHGTAITVRAALRNSAKVVGKKPEKLSVVVLGVGAAGKAVSEFLFDSGISDIIPVDRNGIVSKSDEQSHHRDLAKNIGIENDGSLEEALNGADAVVGLSTGGALNKEHIRRMSDDSIVFALANPEPEIMPAEAEKAGAAVTATGRSDLGNQVNNSLAFPGIFRAVLRNDIGSIDFETKDAASKALESTIEEPTAENIVPESLDQKLAKTISDNIASRKIGSQR